MQTCHIQTLNFEKGILIQAKNRYVCLLGNCPIKTPYCIYVSGHYYTVLCFIGYCYKHSSHSFAIIQYNFTIVSLSTKDFKHIYIRTFCLTSSINVESTQNSIYSSMLDTQKILFESYKIFRTNHTKRINVRCLCMQ